MHDTFAQIHRRGGYFRVLGYGFLVLVATRDRPPTYSLRRQGHHVGPVWFKVLRPLPQCAQFDGSVGHTQDCLLAKGSPCICGWAEESEKRRAEALGNDGNGSAGSAPAPTATGPP